MIERDLCSRKSIDERSGVTTWTMNLILRSRKQSTSRYEEGFLSGKNKRNKMESPPKKEMNWRVVADMTKDKIQMMPKNIESASSNERWEKWKNDEKWEDECQINQGQKKLYPRQQRQKILSHRLSRKRSDRGLSP